MVAKYCATSVSFRFQRKYHQTNRKLQILTVFWSECILKIDAVLDHVPASSHAKFVGLQESSQRAFAAMLHFKSSAGFQ